MVMQGKAHYSKAPVTIPRKSAEGDGVSGEVTTWYMTPEETKEYFQTKYPYLERQRKMRKSKIW